MKKAFRGVILVGFVLIAVSGRGQEPAKDAAPEAKKPEATAEAAKKPEITAEQVLEKYVEATGGRALYQKFHSSASKGTMELTAQGIRGTLETYAKSPNKFLLIQIIDGIGRFVQGYDGQVAWSQDPFLGMRNMEGAELANFQREATFNADLKWRELYEKVELTGIEKVGEQDAYVIRLVPSVGKPVIRYYDTQTFMLLRMDTIHESPLGTVPMEMYPSDYRVVDGVNVPFQVKIKSSTGEVVMKTTEVKNNIEIDDAKFAKPTAPEK